VTNGGTIDAQVAISLFDTAGNSVTNYNLTVPAGQVVQDIERSRPGPTHPTSAGASPP